MTIAQTISQILYPCNGVTTAFPFNNKIFAASDLVVSLVTNATGASTPLTLNTHYTVSNVDVDTGCTVTTLSAYASTFSIDIRSNTANTQSSSIKNQGDFYPELHEEAFDKLCREVQDLRRQTYTYGIHGPDTETLPWTALPSAVNRKGFSLMFDATSGLPALGTPTSQTLTAGLIGSLIYPTSSAEIAAGITPTNQYIPYGWLTRYGGAGDGSTDNVAPLIKAIAQAVQPGGSRPYAGTGTWNLNSALLPIAIPGSNMTMIGDGVDQTIFQVTGASPNNIFTSLNKTRIKFDGITWRGNSQSSTAYLDGAFWYCQMDNTAAAVCDGFRVQNCRFENFKGSYWMWFLNTSSTYAMRNIRITRNDFTSFAGNSRDPTTRSEAATCVAFQGSTTSANGLVADILVTDNVAECTYIKSFVNLWHGTLRSRVAKNTVLNAGVTGANDDCGAYAVLVYDNSGGGGGAAPDQADIINNNLIAPRSCGVYAANASRMRVMGGFITGQTDLVDATLPKGAIALNACTKVDIVGVTMLENAINVEMITDNTYASKYYISACTLESGIVAALGIQVNATATAGNVSKVNINGNDIRFSSSTSIGINNKVTSSSSMLSYIVQNNVVDSARGIIGQGVTSPNILYTVISGNKLKNAVTFALSWANSTTGAVDISENKFLGGWGSACVMMAVSGTTKLSCKNNVMQNMTSGTGLAFQGVGAQGVLMGNSFVNVSAAYRVSNAGSDLGRSVPGWTGVQGDIVQDFLPVETGSAASKYTRQQWTYGTAWLEQRCLTGN